MPSVIISTLKLKTDGSEPFAFSLLSSHFSGLYRFFFPVKIHIYFYIRMYAMEYRAGKRRFFQYRLILIRCLKASEEMKC